VSERVVGGDGAESTAGVCWMMMSGVDAELTTGGTALSAGIIWMVPTSSMWKSGVPIVQLNPRVLLNEIPTNAGRS
jgi:hypothetical protein